MAFYRQSDEMPQCDKFTTLREVAEAEAQANAWLNQVIE